MTLESPGRLPIAMQTLKVTPANLVGFGPEYTKDWSLIPNQTRPDLDGTTAHKAVIYLHPMYFFYPQFEDVSAALDSPYPCADNMATIIDLFHRVSV